jgi:integrase
MAGKRGNGEGSIYQRGSDGRWVAALIMTNGKRVTRTAKTHAEAVKKLEALLKARAEHAPVSADRSTAAFLHEWLAAIQGSVSPATYERYEQYIRVHVVPALGRVKLGRLTPQHVQAFYADRLAAGLSPTTVNHLHAVLRMAVKQAVRWDLVPRNVVELVRPPRKAQTEVVALTVEQARMLLAAAAGHRFEALIVLAVKTGMRQGELLALRWQDVDLVRGVLQVRGSLRRTRQGLVIGTPKTAASRRKVMLSAGCVEALRRHRVRQDEERRRSSWVETGLVFPNRSGRPVEKQHFLFREFRPLLARAGLPPVTFHALRHTAATLLLEQGTHPKIVQELLGHSNVGMTLNRYSHVTPILMSGTAAMMDRLLDR